MKFKLLFRYWLNKLTKPLKTDDIDFRVTTDVDEEDIPWEHTDILINQKSLFEILNEYELSEASRTKTNRELAGKYIGIDPKDLYKVTLKNKNGKFSAWQCSECRSHCSAHLYCDVKVGLFFVYWSNFRQVATNIPFNMTDSIHEEMREKTKWNYDALRSFKFKKSDFFNKMKQLQYQTNKSN